MARTEGIRKLRSNLVGWVKLETEIKVKFSKFKWSKSIFSGIVVSVGDGTFSRLDKVGDGN